MVRVCYNNGTLNEKGIMKYTLITKTGQIMQFYVKDAAEMYQKLKGGVVISNEILLDKMVENCYNWCTLNEKGIDYA